MKHSRMLILLLLSLFVFSVNPSAACTKGSCCESISCALKTSAGALTTGIHAASTALTTSVKFTAHAGCDLIRETPHQLCALPDRVIDGATTAEQTGDTLAERMVAGMQAAAHAFISFTSSLLRIVFSSFSALGSAILPF